MKLTVLLLGIQVVACAQSDFRNVIALTGGYARDVNPTCCQTDTAASLGVTYGYRVVPHLEAEAGITSALHPGPEIRGASYDIRPNDRFIWLPFGLKGILPLGSGRVELSAGGGGLYDKYSVSNPSLAAGLASRSGWGGYFTAGAAVAVDHKRHFWLGGSTHWFLANTNAGNRHDRWLTLTADLGFRF